MKIKELLVSEDKWARKGFAFDKDDRMVFGASPDAVKWCLLGAVGKCYQGAEGEAVRELLTAELTTKDTPEHDLPGSISQWNDNPKTTFADVRKLVEKLDI
jgi:hypothetical protein